VNRHGELDKTDREESQVIQVPFAKKTAACAVWWMTSGHLIAGLCLWFVWVMTQDETWIRSFFDCASPVFFVVMAVLEWYLAMLCCRQFSTLDPLRRAWLLISIGSACSLVGLTLTHIYATTSGLNPYLGIDPAFVSANAIPSRRVGLSLSGPIHMTFLAAGLCQVLRVYKQVSPATNSKWMDRMAITIVLGFMVRQSYESVVCHAQPFAIHNALNWMTDFLLNVLLVEAILLRRYVLRMRGGGIARCWGAYVTAIFATSLGRLGVWAVTHQYIPWPLSSATWCIWFVVCAAYAIAPAYQMELYHRARLIYYGSQYKEASLTLTR